MSWPLKSATNFSSLMPSIATTAFFRLPSLPTSTSWSNRFSPLASLLGFFTQNLGLGNFSKRNSLGAGGLPENDTLPSTVPPAHDGSGAPGWPKCADGASGRARDQADKGWLGPSPGQGASPVPSGHQDLASSSPRARPARPKQDLTVERRRPLRRGQPERFPAEAVQRGELPWPPAISSTQ